MLIIIIIFSSQGLAHNLQALQHPWLVKAEGREDLEECSLDWGLDGNEYAVSIRTGLSWSGHVGLLLASNGQGSRHSRSLVRTAQ
jgi:hypothetical protein